MLKHLCLVLLLGFALPTSVAKADVTVFAAASLRGALDQVNAAYETQDVTVSYASSAALARQIQQGAPADIFISANQDWMQVLIDDGLAAHSHVIPLLGNRLVVISGHDTPQLGLPELVENLSDQHLAMGFVNAVPAGIYGKNALQILGLWDDVKQQVVQTDNVRAALALVALQEARYGIVYATDALADPRVSIVYTFSKATAGPIIYPAAALNDNAETLGYFEFLQSQSAMNIFLKHGFAAGFSS